MHTLMVYDFLNAHADDEALQRELDAIESGTDEDFVRTIARLANDRGVDLPEELVAAWLAEASVEYDAWVAELDELSDDELDLVSGGSGTTTTGKPQCTPGYQCRACCPNSKCSTCYCPIVGSC